MGSIRRSLDFENVDYSLIEVYQEELNEQYENMADEEQDEVTFYQDWR
jgi:hypothetical protein